MALFCGSFLIFCNYYIIDFFVCQHFFELFYFIFSVLFLSSIIIISYFFEIVNTFFKLFFVLCFLFSLIFYIYYKGILKKSQPFLLKNFRKFISNKRSISNECSRPADPCGGSRPVARKKRTSFREVLQRFFGAECCTLIFYLIGFSVNFEVTALCEWY